MTLDHFPDPAEPELFESAFPRERFPAYVWTERPDELPSAVWTTETTHRDGQQGGLPLTVDQGIRIYELMCAFTGASGAIRQAEFFVYRRADREILEGAVVMIKQRTGRELAKDDPQLRAIHEELTRQFDAGRQTAVEWEEISKLLGSPVH